LNDEVMQLDLKKNNDGITLMELVISMAITAIVLSMLILIINTAAGSFKRTNENVNLQLEAQITVNQLSTILMEASGISTGSAAAPDVKYLLSGSPYCYAVYFIKDENKLYLISAGLTDDADRVTRTETIASEAQYLLAEYVKSFDISLEGKTAKLKIEFELGDQTLTATKNVKLRNMK
jgi:type II secretory pathway component PulJ